MSSRCGDTSHRRDLVPASKGIRKGQRALLARLLDKQLQFKVINMPAGPAGSGVSAARLSLRPGLHTGQGTVSGQERRQEELDGKLLPCI